MRLCGQLRLSDVNRWLGISSLRYGSAIIFWRSFVKRFALCYRSVVCPVLSCLSVTFVHCGQTVVQIKMKLGMQVGLGPGHIVLGGDPAPLPWRSTAPPIFGPYEMPLEYASEWEVVPSGASAHILPNECLSVGHVACYIHNTKAVERS